jgi:hypothetical protein
MRSAKMEADSEAVLFLWSPGALLFLGHELSINGVLTPQ